MSCRFWCDKPVLVRDNKTAVQLYRIAQEAMGNAIKHSHADRIELSLSAADGQIVLRIRDNGAVVFRVDTENRNRRIELIEPGMPTAPIHSKSKRLDDDATAVLVAHGYFNAILGRELARRGFRSKGHHRVRF